MLLPRLDRASVCAGSQDPHTHPHRDEYVDSDSLNHRQPLCHSQRAYRHLDLHPHCNVYTDAYIDSPACAVADALPASNGHAHPPDVHLYAVQYADHTHADLYAIQHAPATYGYACAAHGDNRSDTVGDTYSSLSFAAIMPELAPFLKSLLSAPGLSGYETPVAKLIEEKWRPLLDEISRSRIGSLHGLKKGTAAAGKRPSILVAAHMDAIGLMVTHIVEGGLLHVTAIGGIDARVLPGTPVTVHAAGGDEELFGIIIQPPARTLPASLGDNPVGINYLLVDIGLPHKQVLEKVRSGDIVSFATQPAELAGEVISGHSLDNRASVAALTVALEELQGKSHAWDVWAVATAQEEETLGGAATSAFELHPDLALAVDVTFAKGPGANDWQTFPLGKGPTLGFGPNLHPFLHRTLKELAEKLEIPCSVEVLPRHSGTDAYAMQVAAEGIPTMVIGIPLRYMHTAVEVVAYKDIQRAGRLIAEFIAALEPDFIEKITWDDEK